MHKTRCFCDDSRKACYRVNLSLRPPTTQPFKGIDQKTSDVPGVRGIEGIMKGQMTGN